MTDPSEMAAGAELPPRLTLQECLRNSSAKFERRLRDDPKSAVIFSLGAGLGIGLLIGICLSGPRRSAKSGAS